MSTIEINGKEYLFDDGQVIEFPEGLVGLPEMRKAALIPLPEYEPFCWLASVDNVQYRFIVVKPNEIYADYHPSGPASLAGSPLETFAIVKISSDWKQTTVNLRAPIFVDQMKRSGTQYVLAESTYSLAEAIPQNR